MTKKWANYCHLYLQYIILHPVEQRILTYKSWVSLHKFSKFLSEFHKFSFQVLHIYEGRDQTNNNTNIISEKHLHKNSNLWIRILSKFLGKNYRNKISVFKVVLNMYLVFKIYQKKESQPTKIGCFPIFCTMIWVCDNCLYVW